MLYKDQEEINISQIPKFQFQINNQELKSCIKDLNFQIKTQEKTITKLKKDIELFPTETTITQMFTSMNSRIQIDQNLLKLLNNKQPQSQDQNLMKISAMGLSKKISEIAQCLPALLNQIKKMQSRADKFEKEINSIVSQKTKTLQQQFDQFKKQQNKINSGLSDKLQMTVSQCSDKVRQVETKTLWQINDCKIKINDRVSEQMVKDAMKEIQGRLDTKIKNVQLKNNIDPERISDIQNRAIKNDKEISSLLTELKFKIMGVEEHFNNASLSKKSFADQKLQIEKNISFLRNGLGDVQKKMRQDDQQRLQIKQNSNLLIKTTDQHTKNIKKMKEVLERLKVSQDLQKLLQKLDPHKICQIQSNIDTLKTGSSRISKQFEIMKRQVDRLRSKTQLVGILTPGGNDKGSKMDKEEINNLINQFLINNQISRKIQNLESQFLETKGFNEMINDINKKLGRIQKQSEYHNVIYELKGLQQYVKKEIVIMNNRINQLQAQMISDKKKRPQSALQTKSTQSKLMSSVTYKKLLPVNCISCYPNNNLTPDPNSFFKKY